MVWCIPNLREQRQIDGESSMSPCRGSKRHPLESTMSPNAARSISVLSPKSLNDCRAINVLNEKLCRRMTYLVQNQENAPPTPSPNKQPPKPSPGSLASYALQRC